MDACVIIIECRNDCVALNDKRLLNVTKSCSGSSQARISLFLQFFSVLIVLHLSEFQAPRKIHKAERTLETLSGLIEISVIHVRSH